MVYLCADVANPSKTYTGTMALTIAINHLMYHITNLIELCNAVCFKK